MVSQTSLLAYRAIENTLTGRRKEVFDTLADLGEASNQLIADTLGWTINRVTGRMNELYKLEKIKVVRTEPGPFKHLVKVWAIKPEIDIKNVLEQDCE